MKRFPILKVNAIFYPIYNVNKSFPKIIFLSHREYFESYKKGCLKKKIALEFKCSFIFKITFL